MSAGWAEWDVGPPRSNQNESLAWGVLQLLHHLPNMAAGGKAYASRSSHGRLSASTVVASGTHRDNLLNLMASKSIWGRCHLWMVRPSLDSLSATTFSWPGMCLALSVTCFLVHQVKILHRRAQSEPDLITPFLFMYDTTVVLSVATRTSLSE